MDGFRQMGRVPEYCCRCLLFQRCLEDIACKRTEEGVEDTVPLFQPIVDAVIDN